MEQQREEVPAKRWQKNRLWNSREKKYLRSCGRRSRYGTAKRRTVCEAAAEEAAMEQQREELSAKREISARPEKAGSYVKWQKRDGDPRMYEEKRDTRQTEADIAEKI